MDNASAAEANLRWLLRPMEALLTDAAMTDLYINGPGEGRCFVDRGLGMERVTLPYTFEDLEDIAINAAALTRQDIAEDAPLVSTRFPGGQRVQIARPPAVADGQFAFSIRQPRQMTWTPSDLARDGVFANAAGRHARPPRQRKRLLSLYQAGEWQAFLELAVAQRLNIVFSGTVGSGKTHNLKAFTHAIPPAWRLVTIEDMPELVGLPHANVVNLFYSKGGQSVANTRAEDLVEAALRMGMDGLLNQELRDEAAYAYLNVLASGHWGMTTTHADSACQARDRIRGLIKKHPAGRHLNDADVMTSLHRAIDVVVHCVRDGDRRHIEQVLYDPELKDDLSIASGITVPLAAE
jgi:type IV secretion system protein VirB11